MTEIALKVKLPKLPNFLFLEGVADNAKVPVSGLTDKQAEQVGEALKNGFIKHVRQLRMQRDD